MKDAVLVVYKAPKVSKDYVWMEVTGLVTAFFSLLDLGGGKAFAVSVEVVDAAEVLIFLWEKVAYDEVKDCFQVFWLGYKAWYSQVEVQCCWIFVLLAKDAYDLSVCHYADIVQKVNRFCKDMKRKTDGLWMNCF